jgi:hypothetical protein
VNTKSSTSAPALAKSSQDLGIVGRIEDVERQGIIASKVAPSRLATASANMLRALFRLGRNRIFVVTVRHARNHLMMLVLKPNTVVIVRFPRTFFNRQPGLCIVQSDS